MCNNGRELYKKESNEYVLIIANLLKYGKQKCMSMLILSRFSVKFVLQYSTDVGNIFYICSVIVR